VMLRGARSSLVWHTLRTPTSSWLFANTYSTPGRFFGCSKILLQSDPRSQPRDSDQTDVLIIGAGPSGLSTAIKLKQLANAQNKDLRVCVLEKGAEVGSNNLAGAVMEPIALNELLPDWKERGAPLNVAAGHKDSFCFLTKNYSITLPLPPHMNNEGNYIVSISNVCKWLGEQATELGVEIYPATPASEVLFNDDGSVKGVATVDRGLTKEGKPKDTFTRGFELHARLTIFAEGCRGSLTKSITERFKLQANCEPQTFGLGIKELWQVDPSVHEPGKAVHTIGWPLDHNTYGGSWMYHMDNNLVSVGFVVGLDYANPYLSPYKEFQRWKHHPSIKKVFEKGSVVCYGARALVEGGYQSIPRLAFPGGLLVGDTAGFLNVPKIKGIHTAMKSGMIAAESAYPMLVGPDSEPTLLVANYEEQLKASWLGKELWRVRNIRPGFHWGTWIGLGLAALEAYVFKGRAPWTLKHGAPDHAKLRDAAQYKPIEYPKPDGSISFPLLENLARSGTNHPDNQPSHLLLSDPTIPSALNLPRYAGPESRYCPAGVYEYVDNRLVINAPNCLHCKTCDIKDPAQNITWVVPEEGGPLYAGM